MALSLQIFLLMATCFLQASLDVIAEHSAQGGQEADEPNHHPPPSCLSQDDVLCLLARNCTGGLHDNFPGGAAKLTLDRVRFPGTASCDQWGMMQRYEGKDIHGRYANLASAEGEGKGKGGCPPDNARLCFAPDDGVTLDLAFRSVDNSKAGISHVSYDTVERSVMRASRGGDNDAGASSLVLLTTLREPISYATKWYNFRFTWDKTTDMSNYTFEEWIECASWRTNFLTRSLGARDDRKSTTFSMIHSQEGEVADSTIDRDALVEDAYMTEQNDLGPEKSEVYRLALDRLRNSFVHFGIFHRLPDSYELLAHTFCWHLDDDQRAKIRVNPRGAEALKQFAVKTKVDLDIDKALLRLRERNKLDLALMEEAEKIMDERLEVMRAERADGIICDFLGKIKVTCDTAGSTKDEL